MDRLSVRQQVQLCTQLKNSDRLEEMSASEDPEAQALAQLCANLGDQAAAEQDKPKEEVAQSQPPRDKNEKNEQGNGESCDAAYSSARNSCRESEIKLNTKPRADATLSQTYDENRKFATEVANKLSQKAASCLREANDCVSACDGSSRGDTYKYASCRRMSAWVAKVHSDATASQAAGRETEKRKDQIAEQPKHPGHPSDHTPEPKSEKEPRTPVAGADQTPTMGGGAIGEGRPQSGGAPTSSNPPTPSTQNPATQPLVAERGRRDDTDRPSNNDRDRGTDRDRNDRDRGDRDRAGRDEKSRDEHDHDHDHDHEHDHRLASDSRGKRLFETMSAGGMGQGGFGQKAGGGMAPASVGGGMGSGLEVAAMQAQMQAALAAARAANARNNLVKNPNAATAQAQREAIGRADWSQARPGANAAQAVGAMAPASTNFSGGTDFASFASRAPASAGVAQGLQPTHINHFDSSRDSAQLDTAPTANNQPMYKMITVGDPDGGGGGGGSAAMARDRQRRAEAPKLKLEDYLPTGRQYRNGHSPSGLDTNRSQIQPQAKDLFQLVSERFRARCAQNRLFDCKSHLP